MKRGKVKEKENNWIIVIIVIILLSICLSIIQKDSLSIIQKDNCDEPEFTITAYTDSCPSYCSRECYDRGYHVGDSFNLDGDYFDFTYKERTCSCICDHCRE